MITIVFQLLFGALAFLTLLSMARGKSGGMFTWVMLAAFVFPKAFMDAFDGSIHIELGSMAVGFGSALVLFAVYVIVRRDVAKRQNA